MGLLDTFRTTLQERISDGKLAIYAADFGTNSQIFSSTLNTDTLQFTGASISPEGSPLLVNGQVALWNLSSSLPAQLSVIEKDETLQFSIQHQEALEGWSFPDSFPDLQNTYFDNLDLQQPWLISSSYAHSNELPAANLEAGLNFISNSTTTAALASLRQLNTAIQTVSLQGMIQTGEAATQVSLQAQLDQPINLQLTTTTLLLQSGNEQALNSVYLKGTYQKESFEYPVAVEVPTTLDLLDQLYVTLNGRLKDGQLTLYNTDFGDIVAPLFDTAIFVQELQLDNASVEQARDLLTISGNTQIYNLTNQSIRFQVVETDDQRLDFTLYVSPLPDAWMPSSSFPQTQSELFDGLALSEKAMIASSYAQQNVAPIGALVPGLNLYWVASLNEGSLAVLRNIYAAEDAVALRGTVTQKDDGYQLRMNSELAGTLSIAPVGLEAATLVSPILSLSSEVAAANQVVNTAFVSGTYTLSATFSYPAKLTLPDSANINWYLTSDTTLGIQLASMEDAIQLAGGNALSGVFPPSLTSLVQLHVGGNYIQFDLSTQLWAQFFAAIAFLPNQDGTPRYWQILSSPNIAVGNFQFGLSTTFVPSEDDPAPFILQAFVSGEIAIGSVTNLKVVMQIPLGGNWTLRISADNVQLPTLTDLANFIWPQGGHSEQDILAPLPEGLVDDSLSIAINEIAVAFNPFTPALSSVSFDLSQIGSWKILADFEVYGWDIEMLVDVADNYTITGLLHGFMKIGTVADMEISMPIPAGETGWTISLKPGSTIEFPGIGELFKLIGGASDGLPTSFNTFGNFSLSQLYIQFVPQPASIKNFQFALKGKEDWVVLPDFLSFSSVYASLNISQETEGYNSTGTFNAFVNIFNNAIWIQAYRDDLAKNWQFTLAVKEAIHLLGLTDLANWMLPAVVVEYIPETFMPFGKGFDLTTLNINFNITTEVLEKIDFTIVNSAPWHAIGNFLVFDNARIESSVQVVPDDPNHSRLAMHIGVTLFVSSAPIAFTANYNSETPHWVFTARLMSEVSFTFDAFLQAIHLNELFVIPGSIGLPTLTIKTLEGGMTPETGNFQASGSIIVVPTTPPSDNQAADWTVPFLGLELKMFGLDADVVFKSLEPEDPANKNFYKASLRALLDMNSLQVLLTLQLGSAGIDTIFTGTLTVNEIASLQIEAFGDGLVADQPDSDQTSWSILTPNDMQAINYAQAFVYFNQTQNQFFLYGGIANFGDAILLAQKTANSDERGYLFAFALAENFRFSNLFSALSPIDSILLVKNTSIAITTYTVSSATDLVQEVDQILSINDKPGTVKNPIKQGNLPTGAVEKGVHLYAQLLFTGPLFAVFTQLDADGTSGLDVTLYAFISTEAEPNQGSAKTIFRAVIAPFSIISGIVQFSGVNDTPGVLLEYTRDTATEFKLNGTITFQVFGGTYAFVGNLLVNKDQTHFTLTTTPDTSITIQLFPDNLPPIFVLRELVLDVLYYFQTETRPEKQLELQVSGRVELLATIFLQANLYLLNGNPILASVSLTQDFSISSLIGNLVGNGQAWSTDFFDIIFKASSEQNPSRVYYYDAQADPTHFAGNGFVNGYNLEATIDLTFLYTISLQLRVNVQKNVGMEASLGLTGPISIFILELASKQKASEGNKQYIGGPLLTLNTKTETPFFGFATGFNFFEYPFGTADVTIGSKRLSNGRTETKIGAKLTADEAVPIFGNLSVDFTYCQSEGFVVNNWPSFTQLYESIQKIIDIADEVSELMKVTDPTFVCGAIVDLVADVAYSNQFTMSPSFDTVEDDDGKYTLYFVLNGQFSVLVANQQVSTIGFPDTVRIPLPDNTSFDDLGNYIAQALKESASSFVKSLVNNGEQWAQLAAVLFVEQAAELAAQWLCEGLVDALTAEAITAGAAAVASAGGVAALAAGGAAAAAAIAAGAVAAAAIFSSCFTAGTEVILADGSVKPIELVCIGDQLLGYGGQFNSVLAYDRPLLGKRRLFAFNDGPFFVTAEHPFLTEAGWKAIDPEATKRENPNLSVAKLEPGDKLILANGQIFVLSLIRSMEADYNTTLYNFKLSGNNTYFANKLLAHNKGSTCFIAGTEVILIDGSTKVIEDVQVGDKLLGMDGHTNEVIGFDHPFLGNRKLYSLNKGDYFVTAEHPFYTTKGWKAIDPLATAAENPSLQVGTLEIGDVLILANGKQEELLSMNGVEADPLTPLYNFLLSGNNSYYANGYLVHNKGGGGGNNPDPEKPSFASPPLTFASTTLTAQWNGASYAVGYELAFYDPNGQQIGTTQQFGINTYQGSVTIPLQFNGGTYRADLRSIRDSKKSDWVSASIPKLADPHDVQLSYTPNDNKLAVSWLQDGATDFEVTVFNTADGKECWQSTAKTSPISTTTENWIPGLYAAKVTATKQQNVVVVPSQSVQSGNTMQKLLAVSDLTLTANQQSLHASWQDNQAGVDHYLLEVTQGADKQQYPIPKDSRNYSVDTYNLAAGTVNSVLWAIGNGIGTMNGPAATSNNLSKLAPPETVGGILDKEAGYIRCNWSAVDGVITYAVQVVDEKEASVCYIDNISPNTLQSDIPLASLQGSGTSLTLQVKACGNAQILDGNPTSLPSILSRAIMPSPPTLSIADGKLVSSWEQVIPNQGYAANLYNGEQEAETSSFTTDQNHWEILPALFDGNTGPFSVRVLTLADAQTINSELSASSNLIERQATPQEVQLSWLISATAEEDGPGGATVTTSADLHVSWAPTEPSVQIFVEVQEVDTPNILARQTVSGTSNSYNWPANALPSLPNGNYQARVQILGDADKLNSLPGASTPVTIINLPAPTLQALLVESGNEIQAELAQLSKEATGYEAQLLADAAPIGEIIPMQLAESDPPKYQANFTITDDTGNTFTVQARATKEGYPPSTWQPAPDTVARLAATEPAILSLTGNKLSVTLGREVANATAYWAQLVIDGTPSGEATQMVKEDNIGYTASYILDTSLAGKDIQVRIHATANNFIDSIWTLSDVIHYNPIETPQAPLLSIAANMLEIVPQDQWVRATPFEVQLVDANSGVPLDPQPPIQYDEQGAKVLLSNLDANTGYRARIRALHPAPPQLLQNGDASADFNGWNILANGGSGWAIEDGPAKSCPGTTGQRNFVTSYAWCKKAQTIDLLASGFSTEQLDEAPLLTVADWISSRSDCAGLYRMYIELRDVNNSAIATFDSGDIIAPSTPDWVYKWERIAHQFASYGKGLRSIYFEHSGKDTKFWRGNYGSKMTGAVVYLTLPYQGSPGPWSTLSEPIITPPAGSPASLLIVAGNNQAVPRTNLTYIPGGQAYFQPLVIAVRDNKGVGVSGVEVTFSVGEFPKSMAVQIEPSGGTKTVKILTDSSGLAKLDKMSGNSAACYYNQGDFTIIATSFEQTQTYALTVLPTPPLPPLPNAKLTIISGNNQSLPRENNNNNGLDIAKFAPMVVLVSDEHDRPIANAYVSLDPFEHPSGMAVQVDPSGAHPTLVLTDQDGIARFEKFYGGYSVFAYYAIGSFSVRVSVNEGPTVKFNGVVTA
jgi:hypothetical protein